jgi:hypothetical protein
MKKINIFTVTAFMLFAFFISLSAGEHIKDAKIIIKSATGQTRVTTTDAYGNFRFGDLDFDGDGNTLEVIANGVDYSQGCTPFEMHTLNTGSLSDATSNTQGKLRESPTLPSKGSTKSMRPFSFESSICPKGTSGDCDDSNNKIKIELTSKDHKNYTGHVTLMK